MMNPNDQTRDFPSSDRETASNADPITGEPGAHPVGTGIGAAAAGAAATAIGATAGPIGAVVGAVVGSVIGGLVGKSAAESTNPTIEETYWRDSYTSRPYIRPEYPYEAYQLAFQVGHEGYLSRSKQRISFHEAEPELRREYESRNHESRNHESRNHESRGYESGNHGAEIVWDEARYAAEDAWERTKRNTFFYEEDQHWKTQFQHRPYYHPSLSYSDYQLAYRIGYEGFVEYADQNQHFDQVEHILKQNYEADNTASVLPWPEARHAVFDGWHHAAQRYN
ncbi:MAG: glycine zipper family protein [Elainella sp. Prado103]|jgi:hypothetical protein|nr:glycine zipper family protein [Elainella sp. Prado103]